MTLNLVRMVDLSGPLYAYRLFTVTEFQSMSAAQSVFEGIPGEGLLSGKVYTL